MEIRYLTSSNAYIAVKAGRKPSHSRNIHKLLGARVHIDPATEIDGWVAVKDVPNKNGKFNSGFIETNKLSKEQQLKVFYLDVGQGDATLIESENATVIIDGGPNSGLSKYLNKRLKALRRADKSLGLPERKFLFIDAVFVSHFDKDHYAGLIAVLKDEKFRIGTLYHNGLPRYGTRNIDKDLELGTIINHNDGSRSISTDFTDIDSARKLLDSGELKTAKGNPNNFAKFLLAILNGHDAPIKRIDSVKRLVARDPSSPKTIPIGNHLKFEVLAPLTTKKEGEIRLPVFPNPHAITATNPTPAPSESHTINGNSIVLRLQYKNVTFLFGGDLNQPAQKYLHDRYDNHLNNFTCDVNKACHHGSSDFDVEYLKDISPKATVFSSGDNGSYDHPLPDAIGAAAKHSQGEFPLVFSTELARDTSVGGKIMLGHINARTNGSIIVMAQKKEKSSFKNPWHTFAVPFKGPFEQH
ncbi:MAG: MBL fold metallo-hydrolase [Cellulophaga sp.]